MSWPARAAELSYRRERERARPASAIDRPLWNNAIVAPDTHSLKREYREKERELFFVFLFATTEFLLPTSISLSCLHAPSIKRRFALRWNTSKTISCARCAREFINSVFASIVYVRHSRADQAATELKGRDTKENTFSVEMRSLCNNEKKALCGTCGSFTIAFYSYPRRPLRNQIRINPKGQKEERASIKGW
jgi:hypothetical protein